MVEHRERHIGKVSPIQKAISYSMTSILTTGGIRGGKHVNLTNSTREVSTLASNGSYSIKLAAFRTADRRTVGAGPAADGGGLSFDLLSSEQHQVFTGHQDGVITLDLAEGDDVHREQLRIAMAEPYRTLLGHFRHEIGHYYFYRLVQPSPDAVARFTELFGDPDADYQAALDRHYRDGAPAGWEEQYVSSYATMHPAEDWRRSRTICTSGNALDTAASLRFARRCHSNGGCWAPADLTPSSSSGYRWALNMVNRSMGKDDLYLFVLPPRCSRRCGSSGHTARRCRCLPRGALTRPTAIGHDRAHDARTGGQRC